MKTLQHIAEGILGADFDTEVEKSALEDQILRLGTRWEDMTDYNAKKGTDITGKKLEVGDWVMVWDDAGPTFGKILFIDPKASGDDICVITNDGGIDQYVSGSGKMFLNYRHTNCLKLDPKIIYKVLKELCKV